MIENRVTCRLCKKVVDISLTKRWQSKPSDEWIDYLVCVDCDRRVLGDLYETT